MSGVSRTIPLWRVGAHPVLGGLERARTWSGLMSFHEKEGSWNYFHSSLADPDWTLGDIDINVAAGLLDVRSKARWVVVQQAL